MRAVEIAHFVIQAIRDETLFNMSSQQVAVAQQIEEDAPAGNLGVVITAGAGSPTIVVLEAARARHERVDEDLRTEHVEDVQREPPTRVKCWLNSRCV